MSSRFRPRALRAAQLTIAFMMLAVPAEAFAFSGTAGSVDSPASTRPFPAVAAQLTVFPRVAADPTRAAVRVTHRVHGVIAGHAASVAGRLEPSLGGRTITLQRHRGDGWRTIARGRTGQRGGFAVRFRPSRGAHGSLRVVFGGDRAHRRATAAAGMLAVYQPVTVSWYEDGGTTACGFHASHGVANLSLPCGTRVRLRRGGRTVTAVVDDRGPYVEGRTYDLDQSTAAALGFSGVGTVDASVQ